jgi:hypothetical protein
MLVRKRQGSLVNQTLSQIPDCDLIKRKTRLRQEGWILAHGVNPAGVPLKSLLASSLKISACRVCSVVTATLFSSSPLISAITSTPQASENHQKSSLSVNFHKFRESGMNGSGSLRNCGATVALTMTSVANVMKIIC